MAENAAGPQRAGGLAPLDSCLPLQVCLASRVSVPVHLAASLKRVLGSSFSSGSAAWKGGARGHQMWRELMV